MEAKSMDLLTWLQVHEPNNLVHLSGDIYSTQEHDSLKISNGKWMWWSQGIGGRSALDYLVKVRGLSFTEAVEKITGQAATKPSFFVSDNTNRRESKLILPERNSNTDRVVNYLIARGIDPEIIQRCLDEGLLYESLPNHNAIFVGYDSDHVPRYACYRSTLGYRYLGEASGSNKRYSFRMTGDGTSSVHIFEGAIDVLSYATLLKLKGAVWRTKNLLSLAGIYHPAKSTQNNKIPIALTQFLDDNPGIRRIVFHLDNDSAGQKAALAMMQVLPASLGKINAPPPYGKDMNDYLCLSLGRD